MLRASLSTLARPLLAVVLVFGLTGCSSGREWEGFWETVSFLILLAYVAYAIMAALALVALIVWAVGTYRLLRGRPSIGWGVANVAAGLVAALSLTARDPTVIAVGATFALGCLFVGIKNIADARSSSRPAAGPPEGLAGAPASEVPPTTAAPDAPSPANPLPGARVEGERG